MLKQKNQLELNFSKIIVDSTHTNAMFHHISPREELIRQAKELRKSIYKIDESMYDKMPKKKEASGLLEEQIDYLEETMNDTEIELEYSKDQDAKVGHKIADTSFLDTKRI